MTLILSSLPPLLYNLYTSHHLYQSTLVQILSILIIATSPHMAVQLLAFLGLLAYWASSETLRGSSILAYLVWIQASSHLVTTDRLDLFFASLEIVSMATTILLATTVSLHILRYYLISSILGFVLLFGFISQATAAGGWTYELSSSLSTYGSTTTSALIVLALFMKLYIQPLGYWIAPVYDSLRSRYSTLVLLVLTPAVSMLAFSSLLQGTLIPISQGMVLILLGLMALVTAGIAYHQHGLYRWLAYASSVNGWMVLLLLLWGTSFTTVGLVFYLLAYASSILLLLPISSTWAGLSSSHSDHTDSRISGLSLWLSSSLTQLGSFSSYRGPTSLLIGLAVLSFAGLPPLYGLMPKIIIMISSIHIEAWLGLILIMILGTVGAAYYVRLYLSVSRPILSSGSLLFLTHRPHTSTLLSLFIALSLLLTGFWIMPILIL